MADQLNPAPAGSRLPLLHAPDWGSTGRRVDWGRAGDSIGHHLGKGEGESITGKQGKGEPCGPPREDEEVPGASVETRS